MGFKTAFNSCLSAAVALLFCIGVSVGVCAQTNAKLAAEQLIKTNPALMQLSTWTPRESLVNGVYTLHDPHGRYEPYAFDAAGRMLRTNKGWQSIIQGGALGEPLANNELKSFQAGLFAGLKKEEAIKMKFGSGEKTFALLTALDCPNCILLERNLSKVGSKLNATIYIYPMALDYTNAQRMNTVTAIWCRPDAEKLWGTVMSSASVPVIEMTVPRESCGVRTAEHARALTRLFGSYGVPALISPDGEIRRGTPTPEELLTRMR